MKDKFLLKRKNSIDVIHINDVIGLYHYPEYKHTGFSYGVDRHGQLSIVTEEQWVLKTIHQQYEISKKEYGNLKKWILESENESGSRVEFKGDEKNAE